MSENATLFEFIAGESAHDHFDASARGQFAMVPEGWKVDSLEKLQETPNRIKACPVFRNTASLTAYINRFADAGVAVVESSAGRRQITAKLDYHRVDKTPGWSDWTPTFQAQFDPRYARWRNISGSPMTQKRAGEFLEERAVDVMEPDPATIMDMVMQFDALKKVTFRQSTRLHDGQRQFHYQEENEARGAVTLPERIKIRTPVFEGMEPDVLVVRLRYNIDDGKLVFTFEIHDMEQVEDRAFQRCEDAVRVEISDSIPIYSVI
ncbi:MULTISPECIES: DUF2303 family protein [unclassified Mameliella]|uniref:DUF2303 family protein n=1 Tax=unclassified Mameliella TaxID=2630630 RepID=UPI00273E81F6|nr:MULTISPECIES: DUF2303 family protein [unclassified Mameliella]